MKNLAVLVAVTVLVVPGCGGSGESDSISGSQVPFDQAFIDAMVPHHRSAIEMAWAAKVRGLTQELDEIANGIIESQQREIDQMLAWRETWFGSRSLGPVLPDVLGISQGELGIEHGSTDDITNAADADRTFAEMMIPHHEGAIAMAEAAEVRAEHDEVIALSAAIIEAQQREISVLEKHVSVEHHG